MSLSFVRRQVQIAIKLAVNTRTNQPNLFAETGTNQVTISGVRASVRIKNSGQLSGSSADISLWGLTPSLMNQLSTLGMVIQQIVPNTITVTAGDQGGSMSAVFIGHIRQAYGDFNSAPKVPFKIECLAGAADAAVPYPASSYTGSADVATMLSVIAKRKGWGFENNGVNVSLPNPYYAGSAVTQYKAIAHDARIAADLINNVLCIWPLYGNRQTPAGIPLISQFTGMQGYPSFTPNGIAVKTIFDPRVIQGGQFKVESDLFTQQSLQRINSPTSIWNVWKLDLALDAEMPGGEWTSMIQGYNPRYPRGLPQS